MIRNAALIALLLLASACGRDEATPHADAAQETGAPAPAESPVAPMSSRGGSAATAPGAGDTGGTGSGEIDFALPAGWVEEPAGGMRMAQASIPGPGGPGQLAVFYFGPGGGGGVDANIERWVGQMEVAPGTEPKRESFEANGLRITLVDVDGTLLPSTMGSGPTTAQPGSRLLGAVVEGPGGPWFFKATGPGATLSAERDAFLELLRSVRPK